MNRVLELYLVKVFILLLLCSCGQANNKYQPVDIDAHTPSTEMDLETLLDSTLADGFDYPVGNKDGKGKYTSKTDGKIYDSWYIATQFAELYSLGIHPGIDLNGSGGGNTDLGQPVYSIGKGIVEEAKNFGSPWGNVVVIRHKFLENGKVGVCYSVYAHLEVINIKKGDYVEKRAQIGEVGTGGGRFAAHLHFEIRKETMKDYDVTYWPNSNSKDLQWVKDYYYAPVEFIGSHRKITTPCKENNIIIAIKNKYKLYYYEKGTMTKEYEIALSQNPIGHKEKEGDLKLPEGEYYICEKQKGPFHGYYAEFLGPRLLRISYPNIYDAENGYKKGLITKNERNMLVTANLNRKIPSKATKLGGGIVIHGWKGNWIANGRQNLTWGCISMHNNDLEAFFDIVKLNTKIIIVK